jgi:hypothetical protein
MPRNDTMEDKKFEEENRSVIEIVTMEQLLNAIFILAISVCSFWWL